MRRWALAMVAALNLVIIVSLTFGGEGLLTPNIADAKGCDVIAEKYVSIMDGPNQIYALNGFRKVSESFGIHIPVSVWPHVKPSLIREWPGDVGGNNIVMVKFRHGSARFRRNCFGNTHAHIKEADYGRPIPVVGELGAKYKFLRIIERPISNITLSNRKEQIWPRKRCISHFGRISHFSMLLSANFKHPERCPPEGGSESRYGDARESYQRIAVAVNDMPDAAATEPYPGVNDERQAVFFVKIMIAWIVLTLAYALIKRR